MVQEARMYIKLLPRVGFGFSSEFCDVFHKYVLMMAMLKQRLVAIKKQKDAMIAL